MLAFLKKELPILKDMSFFEKNNELFQKTFPKKTFTLGIFYFLVHMLKGKKSLY